MSKAITMALWVLACCIITAYFHDKDTIRECRERGERSLLAGKITCEVIDE